MFDNKWQKKEMPLVSLIGMGGGIASPAFLASIVLNILKPTVFSPVDDTGVPDFDYTAESSAITDISTVDELGDDPAFSTSIWYGNDQNRTITTNLDMSGEGGMVWLQRRDAGTTPLIYDTERGAPYHLETDGTTTQSQFSGFLTGFTDDGFTIGTSHNVNSTGSEHVAWSFQKEAGFFDIQTWTGDSVSGREIPHDLGTVPGMIIIKCTSTDGTSSAATDWVVHHKSLPNTEILKLNSTNGSVTSNHLHNTTPTDQVFSVGSGTWVNSSLSNR